MERERFLDAIAQRLSRPRLRTAPPRSIPSAIWPPTEADLSVQFIRELESVGAAVTRAHSLAAVLSALDEAITASGQSPTVAVARSEFEALGLDTKAPQFDRVTFWGDPSCRTPARFRRQALTADLGITTAVSAVAATGTLVLTASSASPRSTSLLPRRHLALIHERQILPHLGAALALGAPASPSWDRVPSALFCITGPSRTSDIENDLSIGVHGPAQVHVVVYSERAS